MFKAQQAEYMKSFIWGGCKLEQMVETFSLVMPDGVISV